MLNRSETKMHLLEYSTYKKLITNKNNMKTCENNVPNPKNQNTCFLLGNRNFERFIKKKFNMPFIRQLMASNVFGKLRGILTKEEGRIDRQHTFENMYH